MSALELRARARGRQLVVVWGRRRTGKTFLLQHFAERYPTVYFGATQQSPRVELENFTAAARETLGRRNLPDGYAFPDWSAALDFVAAAASRRRLVVVLDEFPYLAASTRGLESIVQRWWDHTGSSSRVMLILCGSSVAYMQQVTGRAAPLHQRATASIHVRPLDYRAAAGFVQRLPPAQRLVVYGVVGGTPLYLEQWDDRRSIRANLNRLFADPASPLVDAGELVLSGELPETEGALRILQAVALGRTRAGEIGDYAGVALERPLKRLTSLGILERRVPALENPARTKRSVYRVADPYFRFWFRFIAPGRTHISRGLGERLVDTVILPRLNDYMGPVFEEVCREHARGLAAEGVVDADRVESWWSADGRHEIDLVGLSGDRVGLVGSVKWSARELGPGVLAELERHAAALPAVDPAGPRLLYGRAGCGSWAQRASAVRCFSADDLYT